MKFSRSNRLFKKSLNAAKAAIELYNKPVFPYRNESFAILMINAWELLLKAKKLKENNNKMTSIYVKEKVKNKKGVLLKKERYKTNRTGNFLTLGILDLIKTDITDKNLIKNLELLIEIRDNAVHCFSIPKIIEKHYLDIITATLCSYQKLVFDWFSYDLTKENMFIIPVGFNLPESYDLSDVTSKEEKNILKYISEQRNSADNNSDYDIALNINFKISKSKDNQAQCVRYSENGLPITIDTEEVFKSKYPLTFSDLKERLQNRYTNFKIDKKFWNKMKELKKDKKYAGIRYLDYYAQKGMQKIYYNTEILKEFDKIYTKK